MFGIGQHAHLCDPQPGEHDGAPELASPASFDAPAEPLPALPAGPPPLPAELSLVVEPPVADEPSVADEPPVAVEPPLGAPALPAPPERPPVDPSFASRSVPEQLAATQAAFKQSTASVFCISRPDTLHLSVCTKDWFLS